MNINETRPSLTGAAKAFAPKEAVAVDASRCKPDDYIANILKAFKVKLNPKCDVIYYPGSATDTSPSEIFPQARVMYVDIDEKSVSDLKQDGKEAHHFSAVDFVPNTQVDLLVLFGAGTFRMQPAKYVAVGGYVVCNNYYCEAEEVSKCDDFKLVGIVANNPNKSTEEPYILDINESGFNEYGKKVSNDEEFKQVADGYFFETAARLVQELTGKTTNITQEYAKLLDSGEKIGEDGGPNGTFIFRKGKQPLVLLPLPSLKPASAFVFQRFVRIC